MGTLYRKGFGTQFCLPILPTSSTFPYFYEYPGQVLSCKSAGFPFPPSTSGSTGLEETHTVNNKGKECWGENKDSPNAVVCVRGCLLAFQVEQ